MTPRRLRRLRIAVRVLPVVIIAAVIIAGCSADRLVLSTNTDKVDSRGAKREVVNVDGRAIECWISRSPGATGTTQPSALVLFLIGKGGRADEWVTYVAESWGQRPVEIWGMNYPGSGGSDGPPKLAQVGPDACGVFDAMKKPSPQRPIFLYSASFGTAVALHVAAHRPVAGLLLQNPPPLKQLILGHYGWWNLWLLATPVALQIPDDLDSLANGARCTAPALFMSFGADEVIPHQYHKKVIDAYAGPKRVMEIPGLRHADGLPRAAADDLQVNLDWLWQSASLTK